MQSPMLRMAVSPGGTASPGAGLTLITGPSGGGKSRWAEHLAVSSGRLVVYLATGPQLPDDADWQRRLQRHRRRRPPSWICREVAGDLVGGLAMLREDQLALVDSLGTWVATWLAASEQEWQGYGDRLSVALQACPAPVLLVCEQVGWGVVPTTAEGCRFRQRLAELEQRLMAESAAAWLVAAGRALDLHRLSLPVPPES